MIASKESLGSRELRVLETMAHALAETSDFKEIKALRDKAEAARKYAQSAALSLKIQNRAAELKLLAERRAGELLEELVAHGGNRRSSSHDENLKLSDLGIDHNQSSRWRREAAVPEPVFEQYIAAANKLGQDITAQGLLRLQRAIASPQANAQTPQTGVRDRPGKGGGPHGAKPFAHQPAVSARGDAEDSAGEIHAEMRNHRQLLEEILKPFCDGESATLQCSEKRLVLRLLAEIEQLLSCLGK